ncbi:MAG: large subunit ribosomal protein L17 [Planctomycetota bacterium]|jgi:large subunit ribosomal protein L17
MRHRVAGRKLNRSPEHRRRLLQNMAMQLIKYGRIVTTVEKAKEVRPYAERLITLGKDKNLNNVRRAVTLMGSSQESKDVARHLFENVAPLFKDRPGGYTRIMRLSERRLGDGGSKAIFELVTFVPGQNTDTDA